jgi:phosphoenolpyruvate---glycerone phosphotransferase subunit DhaL
VVNVNALLCVLAAVCDEIQHRANELNELDGFAGDGDMGITMSRAAKAVATLLATLDGQPANAVLLACGQTIAKRAPSTSGTLVAAGLIRAGQAASAGTDTAAAFAALLEVARAGVADRGKAQPGSKTMLDALAPAAAAAAAAAGSGLANTLEAAAHAADAGARATKSMRPRHGRARWLSERSDGHEDAGARFIAIVLAAAWREYSSCAQRSRLRITPPVRVGKGTRPQ